MAHHLSGDAALDATQSTTAERIASLYRAPGETGPLPNASATVSYGLSGLGVVPIRPIEGPALPNQSSRLIAPTKVTPTKSNAGAPKITTGTTPPVHKTGTVQVPAKQSPVMPGSGAPVPTKPAAPPPNTTPQPPPPGTPGSGGTGGNGTGTACTQPGYYVDSSGNCTNDWHNPYDVTLQASAQPSNQVQTDGCGQGYELDAYGNCVVSSQDCPSGLYPDDNGNCIAYQGPGGSSSISSWLSSLETWLGEQTIVSGVPNYWFAGGGALLVTYFVFRKKRR